MTTWIETNYIHQNGTPVTRRIKLESYDSEVWFTTNAYAEVADDVADILATTITHIEKLSSAPVDPGDYYGDAGHHEVIEINVVDGTFDNIVAQSIDVDSWSADTINASELYTDRFLNTIHYVSDNITASQLNSRVNEISTDEGGEGGSIILDSNVTVTVDTNGGIVLKSDTALLGNNALATAEDGMNADYPPNGIISVDPIGGLENVVIKDLRVDGNALNNMDYTQRQGRHGIGVSRGVWDGSTTRYERPENVFIQNVNVRNTISSNIGVAAKNVTVDKAVLGGSADDHFVYGSQAIGCTFNDIHCSGTFRGEAIVIGDSEDDSDAYGNLVENVTLEGLDHNNPTDQDGDAALRVRPSPNGDVRDNTFRDISIEAPDQTYTTNIRIEAPSTLDGITWRGEQSPTDDIIDLRAAANGSSLSDVTIEVTGGSTSDFFSAVRVNGPSDVRIDGLDVSQDDAPSVLLRGVSINDGGNSAENVLISNYIIDATDQHFSVVGNGGGIRQVGFDNGVFVGAVNSFVTGTVTYADGTMLPQDVTQINNPHGGYVAHNDGTTGTSGPVHYTEFGNWVSTVDGTTIS